MGYLGIIFLGYIQKLLFSMGPSAPGALRAPCQDVLLKMDKYRYPEMSRILIFQYFWILSFLGEFKNEMDFQKMFFSKSRPRRVFTLSKKTNAFSFSTRSHASRLLLLLLLLRSSEARLPSHASAMARRARDVDVD